MLTPVGVNLSNKFLTKLGWLPPRVGVPFTVHPQAALEGRPDLAPRRRRWTEDRHPNLI